MKLEQLANENVFIFCGLAIYLLFQLQQLDFVLGLLVLLGLMLGLLLDQRQMQQLQQGLQRQLP